MKLALLAVIPVVASVIGFDSSRLVIDKGLIDGLRPGDRGAVFYVLRSDRGEFRFELGGAEVGRCSDQSCWLQSERELALSPGYKVDFSISENRTSLESLVALFNERLTSGDLEAAELYLTRLRAQQQIPGSETRLRTLEALLESARQPPPDPLAGFKQALAQGDAPLAARRLSDLSGDLPAATLQEAEAALRALWAQTMILVPEQRASFGLSRDHARYFNQTPRFSRVIPAFWIDRRPAAISGVTYHQAEAHCRTRGLRLPSEFEWELATRQAGFEVRPGLSEWTSSWYQPYPGNSQPEPEYGQRFKVVKGFDEKGRLSPQQRFYLSPAESDPDVGVRCARDDPLN